MPEIDYGMLFGRIKSCGFTQDQMADMLDITRVSMSLKLHNKLPFKTKEIVRLCEILDIPDDKIGEYFFSPKVEKSNLGEQQ